MLKVFRDNLKNLAWILWAIIALFVLALAVEFGGNVRQANQGQNVAATVGSERVTTAEFQRAYQNQYNRFHQMYGDQFTPELAKQMRLPLQALDTVIGTKILLGEARRLGLTVSDAELRDQILDLFKDEQGNFIGQDEYVRRRALGALALRAACRWLSAFAAHAPPARRATAPPVLSAKTVAFPSASGPRIGPRVPPANRPQRSGPE